MNSEHLDIWSHEVSSIIGFNPYETVDNIVAKKLYFLKNNENYKKKEKKIYTDCLKLVIFNQYIEKTSFLVDYELPLIIKHSKYNFLHATIDGVCIMPNNEKRLLKMNYKKNYRYNDITPNKIAPHQFCELQIILECFDCDSIDYVRFRFNSINIINIKRNPKWISQNRIFEKLTTFLNNFDL